MDILILPSYFPNHSLSQTIIMDPPTPCKRARYTLRESTRVDYGISAIPESSMGTTLPDSLFGDEHKATTTQPETSSTGNKTNSPLRTRIKRSRTETTPQPEPKPIELSKDAEVVTLDDSSDLIIVVGRAEQGTQQKKFHVRLASLEHISKSWKKKFDGRFAEKWQEIVWFPDDSATAVLTVLRIAHFRWNELPVSMSKDDLIELASLCDKYDHFDLTEIVLSVIERKGWLREHKGDGITWPDDADLGAWANFATVFGLTEDLNCLANQLAMKVMLDEEGIYYYMDDKKKGYTYTRHGNSGISWVFPLLCYLNFCPGYGFL